MLGISVACGRYIFCLNLSSRALKSVFTSMKEWLHRRKDFYCLWYQGVIFIFNFHRIVLAQSPHLLKQCTSVVLKAAINSILWGRIPFHEGIFNSFRFSGVKLYQCRRLETGRAIAANMFPNNETDKVGFILSRRYSKTPNVA